MKKITNHIPNAITSLNAVCGVLSILLATKGFLYEASLFILLGAFFDFFDGLAARSLNAYSPMGKELDSLSDMVTFGVAPSVIMVQLFIKMDMCHCYSFYGYPLISLLPILIAVFSGLRLAKFNIDTRQTESFLGVPTPATAMFIASFPLMNAAGSNQWLTDFYFSPAFLIISTLSLCLLMVSELPLFSLKVKSLAWSKNYYRYILLAVSIILLAALQFAAIPIIIILYILLSLFIFWTQKK